MQPSPSVSAQPSPTAPFDARVVDPGADIDCGPIIDQADCWGAIAVALTAKLNPPPAVALTLRRPRPDDDCAARSIPCDAEDLIVTIQSGDAVQDVALARTTNGWLRIDLIR